jgi:RNA recognition motif-containing protein
VAVELKISLYHLMSAHGEVIELNLRESNALRGQAFVTFRDQDMTDRALKEVNGFNLFGQKIVSHYAFFMFNSKLNCF